MRLIDRVFERRAGVARRLAGRLRRVQVAQRGVVEGEKQSVGTSPAPPTNSRDSESEVEAPAAKQCATSTCGFPGKNCACILSMAACMQAPAPRSVSSPSAARISALSK